jgi:hypothetical protein
MARTTNRKRTGRKVYAILVDGETEKWYLDKLRAYENPKEITIKPDLPNKTSLEEQFENVKRNAIDYDVAVWIVDLDVIIAQKKVTVFNKYLNEIRTKLSDRIFVLVNTPSLEFWFLQHVCDSGKYYSDCASLVNDLRKHNLFKGYAKTEKYFIHNSPDIYKRLRSNLSTALVFPQRRGNYNTSNPKKGIAEIYKLFDILGVKIE